MCEERGNCITSKILAGFATHAQSKHTHPPFEPPQRLQSWRVTAVDVRLSGRIVHFWSAQLDATIGRIEFRVGTPRRTRTLQRGVSNKAYHSRLLCTHINGSTAWLQGLTALSPSYA